MFWCPSPIVWLYVYLVYQQFILLHNWYIILLCGLETVLKCCVFGWDPVLCVLLRFLFSLSFYLHDFHSDELWYLQTEHELAIQ